VIFINLFNRMRKERVTYKIILGTVIPADELHWQGTTYVAIVSVLWLGSGFVNKSVFALAPGACPRERLSFKVLREVYQYSFYFNLLRVAVLVKI